MALACLVCVTFAFGFGTAAASDNSIGHVASALALSSTSTLTSHSVLQRYRRSVRQREAKRLKELEEEALANLTSSLFQKPVPSKNELIDQDPTAAPADRPFDAPALLFRRAKKYGERKRMERKLKSIPQGWKYVGPAPRNSRIQLDFFVKQENVDVLEKTLMDVADPDSANYGRFWNVHQINKLVAPSPETLRTIFEWFAEFNLTESKVKATPNGDILSVTVPVSLAESMLQCNFSAFLEPESKRTVLRTDEYFLPEAVSPLVDFIGPTVRFPQVSSRGFGHRKKSGRSRSSRLSTSKRAKGHFVRTRHPGSSQDELTQLVDIPNPELLARDEMPKLKSMRKESNLRKETDLPTITPDLLKKIYGTENYKASGRASLGIASFLNQFMSSNDLQLFFNEYCPNLNYTMPKIVGFNNETMPGAEANLDIQYVMAMSEGIRDVQFWSTLGHQDGNVDNEPFLEFLFDVANSTNPPTVFSISYGDDEETVFEPYARRVNIEFQKAGLRGISILVASGDGGVAGSRPNPCVAFVPTYPAASPWVTAVGGTTSFSPEIGATLSGGGFSNRWERPEWQKSHVEGYFKEANPDMLPDPTRYNQTGAGFPDVSAQSLRFPIVLEGEVHVTDGTSASAPVFAAIVALLNDIRAQQGKGPLGFLNPLFYKRPEMFNDIVDGFNPGCDLMGFTAAKGWDPVTGLGTPNFEKMRQVIEALP